MKNNTITIDGKKYNTVPEGMKCIYITEVNFKTLNEETDSVRKPFEKLEASIRSLEHKDRKKMAQLCIDELKRRFNLYGDK